MTSRFNRHIFMTRKLYLFKPSGHSDHTEMTYSNLQVGTLSYDFLHFRHLDITIGKRDREYHTITFHIFEHCHHLVRCEPHPAFRKKQAMTGDSYRLEPTATKLLNLRIETRMTHITETAYKKSVGGNCEPPLQDNHSDYHQ